MRRPVVLASIALLALVLAGILAFAGNVGKPSTYQVPQGEKPKYAQRVVILSIDAAKAILTYKYAQEGLLPGIKKMMDEGAYAKGMIVSFPSATAVSHAVMSTGAPPYITGITGNSIHLVGLPVNKGVSGFNGKYLQAEPIWVTADKQGLLAVVAAFPQSTPSAWEGKVKRAVLFNPYDSFLWPISYSKLYTTNSSVPAAVHVTLHTATGWSNLNSLGKVYRAYEFNFTMGDDVWWVLVYDSNGDLKLDHVAIVPGVKDAAKAVAVLAEGQWSKPVNTTITYNNKTYVVAPLFKLINASEKNFRLYRSLMRPFNAAWFNNETLAKGIWNNVVVKVGMITDGDWWGLTHDWFGLDTYMETLNFTNQFFMGMTKYLMEHTKWNLLMTYTPIVDNAQHELLGLTDPSMPYYNKKLGEEAEKALEQVYEWADRFVQMLLNNVNLSNTAVIVVSDHGQWSVAKLVYINSILYNAGLLKVDSSGHILWNETKAYYFGYNQIFVNLKGREEGGIVDPSQYDQVVNEVKAALEKVVDPDTGQPVFSLVMSRDEACVFGLCGERAGDVVFSLRPGYAAWGGIKVVNGTGVVFENAVPFKTVVGWHGDLPYYKDLLAIFLAVGPHIKHEELGYIRSISVAPTIAMLLGINPPANATGFPLPITEPVTWVKTVTETSTVTTTATKTVTTTAVKTTTVTSTKPVTVTKKITSTVTITSTFTSTKTSTATVTATKTTATTTTATVTVTTTKTVEVTNWGATAGAAIILLIIGLAIGYLASKRK